MPRPSKPCTHLAFLLRIPLGRLAMCGLAMFKYINWAAGKGAMSGSRSAKAPQLGGVLGIVLAAASFAALGKAGWYWLGIGVSVSLLLWSYLHRYQAQSTSQDAPRSAVVPFLRPLVSLTVLGSLASAVGFIALLMRSNSEPAEMPAVVVAKQAAAGVKLYESALGDNFKVWALDVGALQGSEGPESEAPILGAWWSLADWCIFHHRATVGTCYDLASHYVEKWFEDPRAINADTWKGAGAIAGVVIDAYDSSQRNLGESETGEFVKDLFAGRPGVDLLCEPSCHERMDE